MTTELPPGFLPRKGEGAPQVVPGGTGSSASALPPGFVPRAAPGPVEPLEHPADTQPTALTGANFEDPNFGTRTRGAIRDFFNTTAVGRVMSAFGEGVSEVNERSGPLGLDPESVQWLRDNGVFDDQDGFDLSQPIQIFNEAIMMPAAALLEGSFRTIEGMAVGGASAIGQTAVELGADQGMGKRLTRDVLMMAETVGILSMAAPALSISRGAATRGRTVTQSGGGIVEKQADARRAAREANEPIDVPKPAPDEIAPGHAGRFPGPQAPSPDGAIKAKPERAGNINLERINAGEDVKEVIRDTASQNEGFLDARRGAHTLEETEELANALGMTPADLAKRNIGQAFNAEELVAARSLLVESATEVKSIGAKIRAGDNSDSVLAEFQEAMQRHAAIQEQVAGATAEAGRALSSFRILAGQVKEADELAEFVKLNGGRDNLEDLAAKMDALETTHQVSKFAREATKATTKDKILEAWVNALLSGPQTHVVNAMSNSLQSALSITDTGVAVAIGRVRSLRPGANPDRVRLSEIQARLFGTLQGMREGTRLAKHSFITELPSSGRGKIELARPRAIGGKVGEVVRVSGRALLASDEFFKSVAFRQDLYAQAYRQAAKEGLRGNAFKNRIAKLVSEPSDAMVTAAREFAEKQTFTNPLGPFGRAIQGLTNSPGAAGTMAKVVAPFVRTPTNIFKTAVFDRSPLGLASKELRETIRKGGPEADMALGRMSIGSMIATAAASLAAQGVTTGGGPSDPEERAALYATGWQPYSVLIGDTYYSYGRMEPLGMVIGMAADMQGIANSASEDELAQIGSALSVALAKNLTSKTWLEGVSNFVEAASDPDRYGERYFQDLAGTLIPTGVAQVSRSVDPVLRDTRTIMDSLKSRIPFVSEGVPPRRDIFGEVIKREGGVGPDVASPIFTSRLKDDPVAQELVRLGVAPSRLKREIAGVDLNAKQYDEFQRIAGRHLRQVLNEIVAQPNWSTIPTGVQIDVITRAITRTRSQARKHMQMRYPSLIQKAVQQKIDKLQ